MAHRGHGDGIHLGNNSAADSEPIPLQDLSSTTGQVISPTPSHSQQQHDLGAVPWGAAYANTDQHTQHRHQQRSRARSIVQAGVGIGRRLSTSVRSSYDRVHDHTPSNFDGRSPFDADADLEPELAGSSAQLQQGFEEAIGLSSDGRPRRGSWLPPRNLDDATPPYLMHSDYDDRSVRVSSIEIREVDEDDDRAGLTIPENIQPMSGSNLTTPVSPFGGRNSRFGSPNARLGDDLEHGMGGTSGASSINSRGSLSVPSASPVRRLSIAVQRMSERVVNLGNDSTVSVSRKASQTSTRSKSISIQSPPTHRHAEFDDYAKEEIQSPDEKPTTPLRPKHPSLRKAPPGRYNPLKGKTLGIFGPNNKLRLFLCDVICHPYVNLRHVAVVN
jgi:voltage-dependent calcium channel